MTTDETQGWIFTDGYHTWQDEQSGSPYRPGRYADTFGLAGGLFAVKPQVSLENEDCRASWPKPFFIHSLDKGD